jgi:hypothetical protein
MTLGIKMIYQYAECHYAEGCVLFSIMLNVIMLSVVMLNVIVLFVVMLSVVAPWRGPPRTNTLAY